ncbi:DUF4019 domain-containing protein [Citromicrobium bathyomarinum]|uniref:DUF4019 domain-containing protein n=1 Tax=Citromicrobium bathyomarinum TaxID=72174 RepID=UPI00315AD00F
MMKRMALVLAATMLAACNPFAQAEGAREQVDLFHDRLNAGDDQAIWTNAGEELRKATSQEDFARLLDTVHKSLGDAGETSQAGMRVNTNTQGTFTTLQMDTQFENGRGSETFLFRGSGDSLKLIGYHINSPDMMSDVFAKYADEPSEKPSDSADAPEAPAVRIAPVEQ